MRSAAIRGAVKVRLSEIAARNGGRLTPALVVADARDKDSPLHSLFEWDVKKAAMSHWLEQAREVIRSVNVVITTETVILRAPMYVRDPSAAPEQGYRTLVEIKSDVDLSREALLGEFQHIAHLMVRAKAIARVLDMVPELDALLDSVGVLQERLREPAMVQ